MHVHLREPGRRAQGDDRDRRRGRGRGRLHDRRGDGEHDARERRPRDHALDDRARARRPGLARVLPIAAVTKGLAGEALTDFAALRAAGAVAFSDDGMPIMDAGRSCAARSSAGRARRRGGHRARRGSRRSPAAASCTPVPVAERLGLPGMPASAESAMVDARLRARGRDRRAPPRRAHQHRRAPSRRCGAARAAGTRVTRGGDAASFHARRRGRGRARHARQDESAAPDRRRRRGGARRRSPTARSR